MNKLNRGFVWFLMLTKRLMLQWGFLIMLCAIPLIVSVTNVAMSDEDNGILHIALSYEGKSEAVDRIINKLKTENSVLQFDEVGSPDEARQGVRDLRYDAAWVFPDDFTKKLDEYITAEEPEPFIEIFEREETIPLRIAKQKLFSGLYSEFSYSVYKNYMYKDIVSEENVPEKELKDTYDNMPKGDNIIKIERIDGKAVGQKSINYLNAPVRGLLSLIVILCTLTGAMYFLKDMQEGKYDWLPYGKRILPAWASCFAASLLSSIIMMITVLVSGIGTGILNEIVPTILFAISSAGFGTLFCMLVRSPGKLGALVPGIIIAMLVISPIFFDLKSVQAISCMLPTYYYLYAIQDMTYWLYSSLYCVGVYAIIFILNKFVSNVKSNKSIL